MPSSVLLTRTIGVASSLLSDICNLLSKHHGPMTFRVAPDVIQFDRPFFDWQDLFAAMNTYRTGNQIADDVYLITLTDKPNSLNWFSAPDPGGTNNIFIQASHWEKFIYCNPLYPLAYEVVANVLQRQMFSINDDLDLAHNEPIGCVNDLCGWKADIHFKFRTGDICPDCIERALAIGIPVAQLQQALSIFNDLRRFMTFSGYLLGTREFDNDFPFNVAITSRKIASNSDPLRKFLFLIDHFDSLIRTAVLFWMTLRLQGNERIDFFREMTLHERPTLGTWLHALRKLIKRTNAGVLNDRLADDLKAFSDLASQENILQVRNRMRGHSYIQSSDDVYKQLFERYLPPVNHMEDFLKPLFSAHQMFHIISANHLGRGSFTLRTRELMGSQAVFAEREFHLPSGSHWDDVPVAGQVWLFNRQESRWYSLDPYVLYNTCPECSVERVLIYDSEVQNYLDSMVGHQVRMQ